MTKNASATIRLVSLLACAMAMCAGIVVWITSPSADHAAATPPSTASAVVAAARDDLTAPALHDQVSSPSRTEAQPRTKSVPSSAPTLAGDSELEVRFDLERPDGAPLVVPRAEIEIALADGSNRHVTVAEDAHAAVRLPVGTCTVRVRADGFMHREQTIHVEPGLARQGAEGGSPQTERLVLWPNDKRSIAVIVQTTDGRPFQALAEDLGLEPKRLFVGAFDVRVLLSPPAEDAPKMPAQASETLATFHKPPGSQGFEMPGGVIGRLELERDPPLWAQLLLFGSPLGFEVIHPGDDAVVFHLDQPAYDSCCARLRLRVVDAHTHAPLADARVSLNADNSKHRRKDQARVAPGSDGGVEFVRILPGTYDLTVVRGDDLDQRRVSLAAKQVLDLGDIALDQNVGIDVVTLDEGGRPISAYIEIATLVSGGRVDEIYPPMLSRRSGPDGHYHLPLPSKRSIVRARDDIGTSAGQPGSGARTPNVMLDPEKLPPQPWKLVLLQPTDVTFEVTARDVSSIEVVDDLGVVGVWPKVDERRHARCEMVPGHYRAHFIGDEKTVLGDLPFDVGREPVSLHGP